MFENLQFADNCPQCAIVTGGGRHYHFPLHPIPVKCPFQIVGVDILELPKTDKGNYYVLVFQDFLMIWPFTFPMPHQKTDPEVIPVFGVPESLLSDRGGNLLSQDVCQLLGIKKLNTMAYHPQCDGMVERFNRTLKAMLSQHAVKFSSQWDQYLHSTLLASYPGTQGPGAEEKFLVYTVCACT